MRIDDRIESLVRDALDAAVRRNPDKLNQALRAFPDDATARSGLELVLKVCAFVIFDIYEGKPDAAQLRELSERIAELETWAAPTADQINTILSRLMSGQSLSGAVPAEDAVILAFVVTAGLLSSLHNEDEKWFNYLDRAEAAIEQSAT